MHVNLTESMTELENIYKNQQVQYLGEETHSESIKKLIKNKVLKEIELKIKWCSVFKLFILILVCSI